MQQSLTITGLAILVIGFVFEKIGISIESSALQITIATIVQIVGGIIAFIGRYRQGDIDILGRKEE